MMASKSMTLSPPLKNFHLLGAAPKRRMYSRVNHVMHTASTMANLWLSTTWLRLSISCKPGMVLSVRATVERTINNMEITATICKRRGSTYWSCGICQKSLCRFFWGILYIYIRIRGKGQAAAFQILSFFLNTNIVDELVTADFGTFICDSKLR